MKNKILLIAALLLSAWSYGQWTDNGTRLTTEDNVGIGTATPSTSLSFGKRVQERLISLWDDPSAWVGLGLTPNTMRFQVAHSTNQFSFFRGDGNDNELFTIKGNGNVGIGTTTPSTPLSFGKLVQERIISLWDEPNAWVGLGLTPNTMRFQVAYPTNQFSFFRGDGNANELFTIKGNGNVGVGTASPGYKLEVNGQVHATTYSAVTPPWPDFVFENNYKLLSLEAVERYIKVHKHLPDIPGEAELKETGLNLPEMDAKLLQKIEELTLYVIDLQKQVNTLKRQLGER